MLKVYMRWSILDELKMWLAELGLGAINYDLLNIAFTHSSFKGMGYNVEDNERLEFLGDAVLDLIIAEILYKDEDLSESEMTESRKSYVSNDQLSVIFDDLEMEQFVRTANNFPLTKNVKAGFVEAFFGAVFIDRGYDGCYELWIWIINNVSSVSRSNKDVSLQHYNRLNDLSFPPPLKNAKSTLQEFCQGYMFGNPEYHLEDKFGPDHDPLFRIELIILPGNNKRGYEKTFKRFLTDDAYASTLGMGKQKREAEMDAAKKMCDIIGLAYEGWY